MNILLSAVGRRVEIVKYFKEELNKRGHKLFVQDIDDNVPALYFGDEINRIKDYTQFDWIMTLIDTELETFKQYNNAFQSKPDIINICYDKFLMYDKWKKIINIPKTNDIDYYEPWVYKKRKGSASVNIKLNNHHSCREEVDFNNYICQEKIKGTEYNVSCYFDYYTEKLIDCFICEKLLMRAGETERGMPVWHECIYKEIIKLNDIIGFRGFIDIDLFITNDNEVKIIDINPRIGGGYPFAYLSGKNFFKYSINNMEGKTNEEVKEKWHYPQNIKIFKYQEYFIKGLNNEDNM